MSERSVRPVVEYSRNAVLDVEQVAAGLLKPREAAAWLRVSERLLKQLDIRRVRVGRLVRYDPIDLQQFADRHGDRHRVTESA